MVLSGEDGILLATPYGAEPADCLAPILIRPVDEAGLDNLYRHAQRLSFLGADGQTPFPVGSPEWTAQLRNIAGQLKNALQNLRRKCRPVFLGAAAETERSQNLRARCRSELEHRCFRTAPESLLALDDSDLVRTSLQEAGLAVHFLGGAAPLALEAIETSVEVCVGSTILYQPFGADLSADEQLWLDDFERRLKVPSGRYQRLTGKNDQELLALLDEQIMRFREDPAGLRRTRPEWCPSTSGRHHPGQQIRSGIPGFSGSPTEGDGTLAEVAGLPRPR